MSVQDRLQSAPSPPHIIGLITGGLIGTGAGIINGLTAAMEGSIRFGAGILVATMISFALFGFLFDFLWLKMPAKQFNRKCWIYWAIFLPVCRILTDVLIPIINGVNVYEYLVWTYSSLTVAASWALLMLVFGLMFGYVFFQAYRFIFRQYMKRKYPDLTEAARRKVSERMDRGRGSQSKEEKKKKRRFLRFSLERGEKEKEKGKKRKSKK